MSDAFWTMIGVILTQIGVIITLIVKEYFDYRRSLIASATAEKVEKTLHNIAEVGMATHDLSNSAMGRALKVAAIALRRMADEHPGNRGDEEAAALAEKQLAEHEAKQVLADQKQEERATSL